jgi:hypothetical protein
MQAYGKLVAASTKRALKRSECTAGLEAPIGHQVAQGDKDADESCSSVSWEWLCRGSGLNIGS